MMSTMMNQDPYATTSKVGYPRAVPISAKKSISTTIQMTKSVTERMIPAIRVVFIFITLRQALSYIIYLM